MALYVHGLIVLVGLRLLLVGCSLTWLGLVRIVRLSVVCGLFLVAATWGFVVWFSFAWGISDSFVCACCVMVLWLDVCYDCCRFEVFLGSFEAGCVRLL